jgi:pimeloyl-ACP methyl ester carboxylesterase
VLAGNSVGSLAALMAAAGAPEAAAGVVLLNCAGGMNNKAVGGAEDWRLRLAMPLFNLIDFLLKKPAVGRFLFDKFRTRDSLRRVLLTVYPSNPAAVDEDLVELLYGPSCDLGALETFVSVVTGPPGPRPEGLVERLQ